jgi:hypothetical protein
MEEKNSGRDVDEDEVLMHDDDEKVKTLLDDLSLFYEPNSGGISHSNIDNDCNKEKVSTSIRKTEDVVIKDNNHIDFSTADPAVALQVLAYGLRLCRFGSTTA